MLGVGCRKPLTPGFENNQAPETWITAAPQDTITTRDALGRPVAPLPGTIPVKFHIYWAGSDQDGAVTGFYYAVVETLPISPIGVPPLPGPKPRDYHFTPRSDSTFVFTVSEQAPDRQHAFFVYAVDNQGKPDATPARFIFNAQDRFPPAIYVDQAAAEGDIFRRLSCGTLLMEHRIFNITDTLNIATVVKDTVPANSVLTFRWHGEPTLPGTYVTGYRYKLDEAGFNVVDSSVHVATYNSGVKDFVAPGAKQFTVRAVDQAGGARQTTRRFQMNMSPSTWYSGPDPSAFVYTRVGNDLYTDIPSWATIPHFTGSLMSNDSVTVLPALRCEHRTFFEIYKNRIYVRSENDTVNMNSWVVLSSGGLDPDSPYNVKISQNDPDLPDTSGLAPGSAVVFHKAPPNGSPIGFRSQVISRLTPYGQVSSPSLSGVYPIFDPTDVRRLPWINAYWPMFQAGKAYALARAEDGNGRDVGGLDFSVGDPTLLADKVDAGLGSAAEVELRKRVITFYVDKAPGLKFNAATSYKAPGFNPSPFAPYTAYASRTIDINLPAEDLDPYDQGNKPARVGGPSATTVLEWWVSFRGKNVFGRDTVFAPDFLNPMPTQTSSGIVLPSYIVSTQVFADIRLCDCKNCQPGPTYLPGVGRCVDYSFPFNVPAPPSPAGAASSTSIDRPGPGSSQEVSRRDSP